MFIQHSRWGQFLASERTWITVAFGIGVDLLICFVLDPIWMMITAVITLSSLGIIARSLINESNKPKVPSGYKMLWSLEDAIALLIEITGATEELAQNTNNGEQVARMSKLITMIHLLDETVKRARRGEYKSTGRRG